MSHHVAHWKRPYLKRRPRLSTQYFSQHCTAACNGGVCTWMPFGFAIIFNEYTVVASELHDRKVVKIRIGRLEIFTFVVSSSTRFWAETCSKFLTGSTIKFSKILSCSCRVWNIWRRMKLSNTVTAWDLRLYHWQLSKVQLFLIHQKFICLRLVWHSLVVSAWHDLLQCLHLRSLYLYSCLPMPLGVAKSWLEIDESRQG